MHLSFTFRSTEANDALKEYAKEKLDRIHKYFPEPIKVHVVYWQQRGYLHAADVLITLSNGLVVKGTEASDDFFSAIDLAIAKIDRQLRRYKDRIRDHKPQAGPQRSLPHRVFSDDGHGHAAPTQKPVAKAPASDKAPTPAVPVVVKPQVIKEEKFIAEPMSVEEAVMRMNLLHESFLCFNNIETHQINVVYRRDDGTYGLIETTH